MRFFFDEARLVPWQVNGLCSQMHRICILRLKFHYCIFETQTCLLMPLTSMTIRTTAIS